MRPILRRLLTILAVTALVAAVPAAAKRPAAEQIITKLEQGFNDSYAANDLPKYFSYYADDFVAIFPEGRTDLAGYRKDWTGFIQAGNKLESVKISDLVIRVGAGGEWAVASYGLAVRTHLADGKTTDERFLETDVWQKRKGRWQISHCHYSAAAPAP